MPWRVALALQEDGWILRNAIVWHKPNAMPQSVLDRVSTRHEMIFLLVKQRRHWFDLDAIREPYTGDRPLCRRARKGCNKPSSIATPWPADGKYHDDQDAFCGKRHDSAMQATGRRHPAAHPQSRCGPSPPARSRRHTSRHSPSTSQYGPLPPAAARTAVSAIPLPERQPRPLPRGNSTENSEPLCDLACARIVAAAADSATEDPKR
ncbi:site-specific DNA-methyltransferase [Nonomuraea sp. PA05]|nr:site-specific DNA-methyltransferase [Nonomuraea sp. PA05]